MMRNETKRKNYANTLNKLHVTFEIVGCSFQFSIIYVKWFLP